MTLKERLDEARKRNQAMDAIDRDGGVASPSDCPAWMHVTTIQAALECALQTNDWGFVEDAFVLAEQLAERLQPDVVDYVRGKQ